MRLAGHGFSTFCSARTGRRASLEKESAGAKPSGDLTTPRGHTRVPWHVPCRKGAPTDRTNRFQSMSTTNHLRPAQQRLRHIAAEWPADPLRPKLQLKTFLAALADHPALSQRAVAATNALHQNRVSGRVSDYICLSDFTAVNHHL
jgi:hypothetical protein